MNKNVIHTFRFASTQKNRLGSCHPLFWSLSRVKIFPQVASHAKKHYFSWNSLHPNFVFREDDIHRLIQSVVRFLYSKLPISPSLPNNRIFLPSYPESPQHLEQLTYHLHLPVIKVPNKSQVPASFSSILVPHVFN